MRVKISTRLLGIRFSWVEPDVLKKLVDTSATLLFAGAIDLSIKVEHTQVPSEASKSKVEILPRKVFNR